MTLLLQEQCLIPFPTHTKTIGDKSHDGHTVTPFCLDSALACLQCPNNEILSQSFHSQPQRIHFKVLLIKLTMPQPDILYTVFANSTELKYITCPVFILKIYTALHLKFVTLDSKQSKQKQYKNS